MKRLTFVQAVLTVLIAPFFLLAFGMLKLAVWTCVGAFVVRRRLKPWPKHSTGRPARFVEMT